MAGLMAACLTWA